MRKTFVSNASASMQQYAQQGKKHEYWFAVPPERSALLFYLPLAFEKIPANYFVIVKLTDYHKVDTQLY